VKETVSLTFTGALLNFAGCINVFSFCWLVESLLSSKSVLKLSILPLGFTVPFNYFSCQARTLHFMLKSRYYSIKKALLSTSPMTQLQRKFSTPSLHAFIGRDPG